MQEQLRNRNEEKGVGFIKTLHICVYVKFSNHTNLLKYMNVSM